MISAFIWYEYFPCRWKIIIFQKSECQKLKNLSVKLGHFGVNLRKNYGSYKVAQSFYRCAKIPSFILDHVWTALGRNLDHRSPKSLSGRFHPPPLYRSTGKPTLIRVKNPFFRSKLVTAVVCKVSMKNNNLLVMEIKHKIGLAILVVLWMPCFIHPSPVVFTPLLITILTS